MGGFASALGSLAVTITGEVSDLLKSFGEIINAAKETAGKLTNIDLLAGMADKVEKDIKAIEDKLSGIQKLGERFTSMGTALTVGITAPLAAFGAMALKASGDFESAMNRVSAQGDITGKDLETLKKQAEDLGAKTQFSSREAAEGMAELAAAGFKTNEVMAAMPGVLNLAAAAGTSVGQAAGTAKDLLGEFGLKAADTGHVVDVLAKASTESSGTLGEMANSLKYVGPVAKSVGMNLEETSAALIVLDQAGIRGEQAGTALRSMLTSLLKPNKDATETLAELGIKLKDMQGNMLPFANIMEQFREKLGAIPGTADKAAKLISVFGEAGQTAASILTTKGAPALLEFQSHLMNVDGTSQRIADTMNKGLNGALERMKGSVETAAQKIGDSLAPAIISLAGFVETAANKIAEFAAWFQKLPDWVQGTALAMVALAAALGPMLILFGQLAQAVVSFNTALPILTKGMTALSGAIGMSSLALGGWILALTAGAIATYKLFDAVVQLFDAQKKQRDAQDLQSKSLKQLEERLIAAGANLKPLADQFSNGKITLEQYSAGLRKMASELGNAKGKALDIKPPLTELQKLQAQLKAQTDGVAVAVEESTKKHKAHAETVKVVHAESARLNALWKVTKEEIDKHAVALVKAQQEWARVKDKEIELMQPTEDLNALIQKQAGVFDDLSKMKIPAVIKGLDELKKTIPNINDAFKTLGVTSSSDWAKQAEDARKAYETIRDSGIATPREITEAWIKWEEIRQKTVEATGGIILQKDKDFLEEMKRSLDTHRKRVKTTWEQIGDEVKAVMKDLQRDIAGSISGALFDFAGRGEYNKGLEEQAADLRKSLEERTADWNTFQEETAAGLAELAEAHRASLEEMDTDYHESLNERAQEFAEFAAETAKNIEEIQESHAKQLGEELSKLQGELSEREQAYAEYAEEVAGNINDIEAKYREQLAETTEKLREELDDRLQQYQEFVKDAQKDLARLREDTATNLERERQDTADNIEDKTRDYNRYVEDVTDKAREIREKNKGQYSQEEADLQRSLQRKKEDLDDYVEEQNLKLARYQEDQQKRLQREEQDHKEALARKKVQLDEFLAQNTAAQAKAETDAAEGIAREVAVQKEALAKRKGDLDKYRAENLAAQQQAVLDHQAELDKEVTAQQTAFDKKKAQFDTYAAELKTKYETDRGNAEAEYVKDVAAYTANLEEKKTEYEAFKESITGPGGKLEEIESKHRTVWGDIKSAMVGAFTDAGATITAFVTDILVGKLFKELGNLVADILPGVGKAFGSIFGGAASAASDIGGGAASAAGGLGGAGGAAGSAAGAGLSGVVGMVSGVVSAVSGVISNFQFAAMNKSLDLIENYTRHLKIAVWEQEDSIQKRVNSIYELTANAEKNYWGVTTVYYLEFAQKLDTIIGKLDLAPLFDKLQNVTETIRDDIRYVRDAVWEARDYLGNSSERLIEIAGAVGAMNTRDQQRAMNPPTANWTVTFSGDPIAKLVGDQIMQQLRMQGVNLVPGVSR